MRAELDVTLISDQDIKKRVAKENKSSPDLTHPRTVKSGDTLATFDNTFDKGGDWIQVDVWISSDGVPVCHHDETVDRTTDGTGIIWQKTLAELKTLDAGSWFDPLFAGEEIPTLAEALTLAEGRGKVLIDI